MAIVYSTAVKKARLQKVIDAIDHGGTGRLKIGTADMKNILAVITLRRPSWEIKGTSMILAGTPLHDVAEHQGKARNAEICDANGQVIISGLTIGTKEENDIIVTDDDVDEGDQVTITSGAIVHA